MTEEKVDGTQKIERKKKEVVTIILLIILKSSYTFYFTILSLLQLRYPFSKQTYSIQITIPSP